MIGSSQDYEQDHDHVEDDEWIDMMIIYLSIDIYIYIYIYIWCACDG